MRVHLVHVGVSPYVHPCVRVCREGGGRGSRQRPGADGVRTDGRGLSPVRPGPGADGCLDAERGKDVLLQDQVKHR